MHKTHAHQANTADQQGHTNVAFALARPAMADKLGAELLKLIAPTRTEPGCRRYEIHQSLLDPHLWMIIENWRARADFDAHMQTTYVREFLAQVPSLCVHDIEIGEYREAASGATNHEGGKS
ncbi:putative quinol monooxygenase [Mycobacterium sp. NPDC003323]